MSNPNENSASEEKAFANDGLFATALGLVENTENAFFEAEKRHKEDQTMIGACLRQWRDSKGVSLRTQAIAMGFSAPYISDLELGRRLWSAKLVENYRKGMELALANARAVTPGDIETK